MAFEPVFCEHQCEIAQDCLSHRLGVAKSAVRHGLTKDCLAGIQQVGNQCIDEAHVVSSFGVANEVNEAFGRQIIVGLGVANASPFEQGGHILPQRRVDPECDGRGARIDRTVRFAFCQWPNHRVPPEVSDDKKWCP